MCSSLFPRLSFPNVDRKTAKRDQQRYLTCHSRTPQPLTAGSADQQLNFRNTFCKHESYSYASHLIARPMASLAVNTSRDQATSSDHGHSIMIRNYHNCDDWRILTPNDATEDALSKILRFGSDIDRVTTKPTTADSIKT